MGRRANGSGITLLSGIITAPLNKLTPPNERHPRTMLIKIEDPASADIKALLEHHLRDMAVHSPPESVHALDLTALQADNIQFFSARTAEGSLQGCAALRVLTPQHGELKSMRTADAHLRQGIAAKLLKHILEVARHQGMNRISLETGTPKAFLPARKLYERFGFEPSPPFGDYAEDPYSLYMTLAL